MFVGKLMDPATWLCLQALPLTSADRYEARPPWMVGTPQLLTPDDPSPFYELAPIPNGEMQFAVDTPCFRWATCLLFTSCRAAAIAGNYSVLGCTVAVAGTR